MMSYDDIPWTHTETWKPGCWYPLPVSSMWCNKLTVVEGYDIFKKDVDSEDMVPVGNEFPLNFRAAVQLCEAHNGWSFGI